MQVVLRRNLLHGFHSLDRFQRHSRLELRTVISSLLFHVSVVSFTPETQTQANDPAGSVSPRQLTIRFNRRYRRSGHLFQGRFKAQLVEADAYAMELIR